MDGGKGVGLVDELAVGMPWRGLRWLWLALAVAALAAFILGVGPLFADVSSLAGPPAADPLDAAFLESAWAITQNLGWQLRYYALFEVTLQGIVFALYLAVAGLILWRRPGDGFALAVAYFLQIMGMMVASTVIAYGLARFNVTGSRTISEVILITAWLLFIAFLFLFPDGRFVPRWTGWVLLGTLVSVTLPDLWPSLDFMAGFSLLGLGVAVAAQIYRYRRVSGPLARQQTKWVALGLSLFALASIVMFPFLNGVLQIWFRDLVTVMLIIVPLTIGFAILQAGLWNVDVVIRRTLLYGLLTAALAVVYFGSIILLQLLFEGASGQQSPLAVVGSTLLIAALFSPLRRRFQRLIDRRFYRRKYDASLMLARFAAAARDEADLERLVEALANVVQETMQPERLWLWLPAHRKR